MSTDNRPKLNQQIFCRNCDAYVELEVSEGQYFCAECGLVIEDYAEIVVGRPDASIAGNYSDLSKKTNFSHFPNSSEHSLKDFSGKKIAKSTLAELSYHQRTLDTNSATLKQRAMSKGVLEVTKHCRTLALPKDVTDAVCKTYKTLSAKGYLKGRHILGSILALIIIVANSMNCPVSSAEALKENNLLRRRFNKEYYYLYPLFNDVPKVAAAQSYFQKYASCIAPFEKQYEVKVQALTLLKRLKFEELQERAAMVTVATILYYVLKNYKYPSLERFLKKIFINRLTIRNTWQGLVESHPWLVEVIRSIGKANAVDATDEQ